MSHVTRRALLGTAATAAAFAALPARAQARLVPTPRHRRAVLSTELPARRRCRSRPGRGPERPRPRHHRLSRRQVPDSGRQADRRRRDRDLAMRCVGHLSPCRREQPRRRSQFPGLRQDAHRGRRRVPFPHHQAGGLSRPHAAHPPDRGGARCPKAHDPALHRRRAAERARRAVPLDARSRRTRQRADEIPPGVRARARRPFRRVAAGAADVAGKTKAGVPMKGTAACQ
jgi:hypothetical protein